MMVARRSGAGWRFVCGEVAAKIGVTAG
jgi:hypothetical protein